MRKYLLDNGPLVALLKGRPGAERLMRPWVVAQEAATSRVVYAEAIEYIKGGSDYHLRREALRTLLRAVTPPHVWYPGALCGLETIDAATERFRSDRRH